MSLRIKLDVVIKFLVGIAIAVTALDLHLLAYGGVLYLSLQKISAFS
ncbi:hypothetical protein [Synechocystis sp. PCC 7509]|nr:hypothetical protein [Synechocystis sp. PCC 7509]